MGRESVTVEVAVAVPGRQLLRALRVPPGTTVAEAVTASAVLDAFPEMARQALDLSVHGVRVAPDTPVEAGDRVEVLRALRVSPREARRRRAQVRCKGRGD